MWRKRLLFGIVVLVGIASGVIGFLATPRRVADDDTFLRHYAPFADVVASNDGRSSADDEPGLFSLRLRATNGLEADILVRVPEGQGPFPALILQGGFRTGKDVVRHVPQGLPPIVWASLDYRIRKPDGESIPDYLGSVNRLKEEAEETVAATLLLLDWLEQQPFVDKDRTLLAGGSLGAFFAGIAGAIEPRFEGVAMLYGAGRLPGVVAVNVPYLPSWKRIGVEWITNPYLGPVDPIHFVGRIAPRPFLMVNGEKDERIPRPAVEALYAAAGEPKELIWLDHGHRVLGDAELVGELAEILMDWMERQGWVR